MDKKSLDSSSNTNKKRDSSKKHGKNNTITNPDRDSNENDTVVHFTNPNNTVIEQKTNGKGNLDDINDGDISHMENKSLGSQHTNSENDSTLKGHVTNITDSLGSNGNKTYEENSSRVIDPDSTIVEQNTNSRSLKDKNGDGKNSGDSNDGESDGGYKKNNGDSNGSDKKNDGVKNDGYIDNNSPMANKSLGLQHRNSENDSTLKGHSTNITDSLGANGNKTEERNLSNISDLDNTITEQCAKSSLKDKNGNGKNDNDSNGSAKMNGGDNNDDDKKNDNEKNRSYWNDSNTRHMNNNSSSSHRLSANNDDLRKRNTARMTNIDNSSIKLIESKMNNNNSLINKNGAVKDEDAVASDNNIKENISNATNPSNAPYTLTGQKISDIGSLNGKAHINRDSDDKDHRKSKITNGRSMSNIENLSNSLNTLKQHKKVSTASDNNDSDKFNGDKNAAMPFKYSELTEIAYADKETTAVLSPDYNYPPKFQSSSLEKEQEATERNYEYTNPRLINNDLCFASKEYMKIPSTNFHEHSPRTSNSKLFQPPLSSTMYDETNNNNDAVVYNEHKEMSEPNNKSGLSRTTASTLTMPSRTVIYLKKDNNNHSLSCNNHNNNQSRLHDNSRRSSHFSVTFPEREQPARSTRLSFSNESNNNNKQTYERDIPFYNIRNYKNNTNSNNENQWNSTLHSLEDNECNKTRGGAATTNPTERTHNVRTPSIKYHNYNELMHSRMASGSQPQQQNSYDTDDCATPTGRRQQQEQGQQTITPRYENQCPCSSGTQNKTINKEGNNQWIKSECRCKQSLNRTMGQQEHLRPQPQQQQQMNEYERSKKFCCCYNQQLENQPSQSQSGTDLKQCNKCGGNRNNYNDTNCGNQLQSCNHSHDCYSESRQRIYCSHSSRKCDRNVCDCCVNTSLTPSQHCNCAPSKCTSHHSRTNLTKSTQTVFFTDRCTNTEPIPPCSSKRAICHCLDDLEQQRKVNCLNEENLRRSSLSRNNSERIIQCPPATVEIDQPQVSSKTPTSSKQKSVSTETTMNERLSRDMASSGKNMDEKSVQVNVIPIVETKQSTPTKRQTSSQKIADSEQSSRQSLLQKRRSEMILDHEREKMATNRADHPRLKSFTTPQTRSEEKVHERVPERVQEVEQVPVFHDDNEPDARCPCTQPAQDYICETTDDDDDDKYMKRNSN